MPFSIKFRAPFRFRILNAAFLLALIGLTAGGCKLVNMGANRLIVPSRYELGTDLKSVVQSPKNWGLSLKKFSTTTQDGVVLPGWIVTRAPGRENLQPMSQRLGAAGIRGDVFRGTIVLLHGINSRKEHMLGICRWLVAAGFQCVVHDSRGHGEAAANYATFGAREVADLGAVLKTARAAAGGRFEPIGIYGYSMGGAIALQSLPDHPEIKAAVTAATFADLQNVLYHQAGMRYHGALKPLMPAVRWSVESKAGFDPFEIRPVEAVKKAQTPLMLIHGEHDTVVPVAHSQRLAQACGKERCVCRMVNGAAHGNVISKGGETLMLEMVQFYMRHLRK